MRHKGYLVVWYVTLRQLGQVDSDPECEPYKAGGWRCEINQLLKNHPLPRASARLRHLKNPNIIQYIGSGDEMTVSPLLPGILSGSIIGILHIVGAQQIIVKRMYEFLKRTIGLCIITNKYSEREKL